MIDLKPLLNLDTFYSDLQEYATISEVYFNPDAVSSVIALFKDIFARETISIRTTTHPKEQRNVNFRWMSTNHAYQPYAMLLEAGLIPSTGHSVEKVMPELLERKYPMFWGIDSSVSHGVEKVWAFLEKPFIPLDEFLTMASLPSAIKDHREYFRKYGQNDVNVIGVDFRRQTMNLYPALFFPGTYTPQYLAGVLADAGFAVPAEEELIHCAKAPSFYFTFSWDAATIQRISFSVLTPADEFPVNWHPLCEQFVNNVPIRAAQRKFVYNPTYGVNTFYLKMEADYVGTLESIFGHFFQ